MSGPAADPPGERPSSNRSNSIPFPSPTEEERLKESHSSESNLTSSDKLSALPTQSSPALGRLKTPTRAVRRGPDASASLTSIDSASGSLQGLHSLPGPIRQSESDSSVLRDTPRQRNESERSLPATFKQSLLGRLGHHSDSVVASQSLRSREGSLRGQPFSQSPPPSRQGHSRSQPVSNNLSPVMHGKDTFHTPPSRSPAQSRAASPLRILQGWNLHRNQTKDEPFVPVDPFSSHIRWFGFRRDNSPSRPDAKERKPNRLVKRLTWFCPIGPRKLNAPQDRIFTETSLKERQRWRVLISATVFFLSDTLPRQSYIWFLLRLPALYWQRAARVFEDAEVSKPEMQRLIDACGDFAHEPAVDAAIAAGFTTPPQNALPLGLPYPEEWNPPVVSPALARFKISWENFVDTLLREWKTFNLVSALLCTTILTIFQIQEAAADPLTRWSALFSLVFALMSLSYGCIYIVHFGTMRGMDRASRWAEEAQKMRAAIFWNIWVLLATPAIWLAWSMISFCVAILSFVWRTGSQADQDPMEPLTANQALAVRIMISVVFAFGLFNLCMIIRTFSSYSHINVRRDRRSRLTTGDTERGRGKRKAHGTPRTHGAASDEEKEREREKPHGKLSSDPMFGLGLTGLGGENANGGHRQDSPRMAGVILENVDLEKGEGVLVAGDRVVHRLSPRVSPKL